MNIKNLEDLKNNNINNILNVNNNIQNYMYYDKSTEKYLNGNIKIKNNKIYAMKDKQKNRNVVNQPLSFLNSLNKKKGKNINYCIKNIEINNLNNNNINDSDYNNNNSISKELAGNNFFCSHYKNRKSRNQRSLNNQFNTNNKINNITYYKDNKSFLNNSSFSERKSTNNRHIMNQSFTNKKQIDDSSNKRRIANLNRNNDNNNKNISLKQKIHLFQQKKEALIKQYSNKNKMIINSRNNNISKQNNIQCK